MTTRRAFFPMAAGSAMLAQSPNNKIRIAMIGFGSRGNYLFDEIRKSGEDVEIVAVCDVWSVARQQAEARVTEFFGKKPKLVSRYQDLLAMPDVDAVIIAAPDYAHAPMLRDIVKAGKDAYCEKPFAIDLEAGIAAYDAVKASKQVVQVGTQRRSEARLNEIARQIRAGLIGKVTRADLQVHYQQARWKRTDAELARVKKEDIDWEAFQMGRIQQGFDARLFREWQLFRATSNGIPGLWMSHLIDLVPWFLDDPYPQYAAGLAGLYLWKDGRQLPDIYHALFSYPKGSLISFEMSLTSDLGWRNLWYGTEGVIDADAYTVIPRGQRQGRPLDRVEPMASHMKNFLECVRSRQTPTASVEAGYQHAVAGILITAALESGRKAEYLPATRKIRLQA
jgi:predicted dehydrogenase